MTARQKQAKHAAEHRHMRDRLLAAYHTATPEALEAGRQWYPTAERVVSDLAERYNVGRPVAAAVVAALSPQTKWRQNIEGARSIFNPADGRALGYGTNRAKAKRIAAGDDPLAVLGGPKVLAFFANLIGSRSTVTVDVWAQRAATGLDLAPPKGKRYERIARAYQAAAESVGELPRDFQAIIWLSTRPMAEHRRDLEALEAV